MGPGFSASTSSSTTDGRIAPDCRACYFLYMSRISRSSLGLATISSLALPLALSGGFGCMAEPGEPTFEVSPPDDTVEPPPTDARGFAPGPMRFRRLVASQYRNAVDDLLGPEAAAVVDPPNDPSLNGLKGIGASELGLSTAEITAYERASRDAVTAAESVGPLAPRFGECETPSSDACTQGRVRTILDRAFRRRATEEEVRRYVALAARAVATQEDPEAGLRAVLSAALQSPHFLYRTEVGVPVAEQPGFRRLTNSELASRVAFFLTDRPPDESLRALAARGTLSKPEILTAEVDRLLATPAAQSALAAFYDEYLRLGELPDLVKDPRAFPQASKQLFRDMREETQRLIADVVWDQENDFRQMFRAPYSFVNIRLATLYGVQIEDRSQWERVDFSPDRLRAGYLGHASFLALNSHPVSSSPTLRGKFVQEVLLCRSIPAPPPDVNTEFPEPPPGEGPLTTRERVAQHLGTESCAGCHAAMDPIGLGLENFDALGAYRTIDNGHPVDATSSFLATDFVGASELGEILATSDRAAFCVVRNLFRHATGHIEKPWEAPVLEEVDRAFAASGYRLQSAMRALVLSDAFQLVSEN